MRKWISYLLPFVGLGLFVFILYRTGLGKIADVFKAADLAKLLAVPAFVLVIVLLRGLRWRYLLKVIGIDYSLWQCTRVWSIGFFSAAVTPAKMGDVIRALYVRENTGRTFGEAFLTVFIDRLWDLFFVLVSGVLTALVFSRFYIELPSVWIFLIASVVIIVCVSFLMNRTLVQKLIKPIFDALMPQKYRERFTLTFHSFYDSLGIYAKDWRKILTPLVLTLACWAVIFLLAYYMTIVFGIKVSARYIILIMPIVTLAELLPTFSGLGTREATVIYFFSVVGVSSAMAVGFSIGYLIAGSFLISLMGFVMWIRHPIRFGD